MVATEAFADVVKQEREADEGLGIAGGPEAGELPGLIADAFEIFEGDERVFVDGIAMVEVPDDQAIDVFPGGDLADEDAGFRHAAERLRSVGEIENLFPFRPGPERGMVQAATGIGSEANAVAALEQEEAVGA